MAKKGRVYSMANSIQYTNRNWIIGDPISYNKSKNSKGNTVISTILSTGSISRSDMDLLKKIAKKYKKNNKCSAPKTIKNELHIGQKLRTQKNDYAVLVGINGDRIILEYKGKCHERDISIIGEKLFVK